MAGQLSVCEFPVAKNVHKIIITRYVLVIPIDA